MTNQRYYSLDVFRGATVALMILVNNPGTWSAMFAPLQHAPWHGCTPTDLVFPFFLFAVGNAMAFVMPKLKLQTAAVFWQKILYYPGDQYPLYLDKKSETLKIIQHLRDEAHRFGITFHRNQRSRKTFVSELENIPGVGKTTVEKVLKEFKSVKKVRETSDEELKKVLNLKQIQALRHYFKDAADTVN